MCHRDARSRIFNELDRMGVRAYNHNLLSRHCLDI